LLGAQPWEGINAPFFSPGDEELRQGSQKTANPASTARVDLLSSNNRLACSLFIEYPSVVTGGVDPRFIAR